MPSMEHLCSFEGDLGMQVIGRAPGGMRIDFPFEGTATSPHWEGERPVKGIDYATVREDGNMSLDIRAVIGEKKDSVSYQGSGVSIANPDRSADPKELVTFATANEELAWLNNEVAVVFGHGEAGRLSLEFYLLKPD